MAEPARYLPVKARLLLLNLVLALPLPFGLGRVVYTYPKTHCRLFTSIRRGSDLGASTTTTTSASNAPTSASSEVVLPKTTQVAASLP